MKLIISAIFAAVLFSGAASAQQASPQVCPEDKMALATGTPNGTYGQMAQTLKKFCAMICEDQKTQGGFDNAMGLANSRFDGGIIQADLVEFLGRTEPKVKSLRSIASLHGSSLHIFTRSAGFTEKRSIEKNVFGTGLKYSSTEDSNFHIENLKDLKGRKVAAWSSAVVTATILSERLGLSLEIEEVPTRKGGIDKLTKGEVYAFMGMGGKPLDWVEKHDGTKGDLEPSNFKMVLVEPSDIARLGAPYYMEKVTYRSFGVNGLPAVTVRNDIMVRNIQRGPMVANFVALQECLKESLEEIQASRGKHPSWDDVSLDNAMLNPYVPPVKK